MDLTVLTVVDLFQKVNEPCISQSAIIGSQLIQDPHRRFYFSFCPWLIHDRFHVIRDDLFRDPAKGLKGIIQKYIHTIIQDENILHIMSK